jgi:hypothetical protein
MDHWQRKEIDKDNYRPSENPEETNSLQRPPAAAAAAAVSSLPVDAAPLAAIAAFVYVFTDSGKRDS